MLREVWGGMVTALRRWPTMTALAGMIAIACGVLTFALGDVLSQVSVLKGGYELRARHAVTFAVHYRTGGVSSVDGTTVASLAHLVERQQAYTAIVNNLGVDDGNVGEGPAPLVLFGDLVPTLFPDLQLCSPAPCAMRGADLDGSQVDAIDVGGLRVPVTGTLPSGATFFDTNAAGLLLDQRVVVRAPPGLLPRLRPIEREEVLTRTVLMAPSSDTLDGFISGCVKGGLYLMPADVAVQQPQRFREIMTASAMYIVGMAGFLALVMTAFISSARATMREERRNVKIREMYGARPVHVTVRVGAFLAMVVLALPLPLLALLAMLGGPPRAGAMWVSLVVVASFVVMWVVSVRDIRVQDQPGGVA